MLSKVLKLHMRETQCIARASLARKAAFAHDPRKRGGFTTLSTSWRQRRANTGTCAELHENISGR